jgi:hypothetical protein
LKATHLWAIGYADVERATHVKDEIARLGWGSHDVTIADLAVVVRQTDGSFTLNREPFPDAYNRRRTCP